MSHVEKSQYTLVDKPLFRKLVCKHDYHHYEGVVFEQGKEYAVWITQCFRPAEKKRRFFHYVAVPHAREEERPFYYIVSEDIFGEYDKGNIEVVTEIGGEKYKLINDFEGWGMLIPKWMFLERQNALSIYSAVSGCANMPNRRWDRRISAMSYERGFSAGILIITVGLSAGKSGLSAIK